MHSRVVGRQWPRARSERDFFSYHEITQLREMQIIKCIKLHLVRESN